MEGEREMEGGREMEGERERERGEWERQMEGVSEIKREGEGGILLSIYHNCYTKSKQSIQMNFFVNEHGDILNKIFLINYLTLISHSI